MARRAYSLYILLCMGDMGCRRSSLSPLEQASGSTHLKQKRGLRDKADGSPQACEGDVVSADAANADAACLQLSQPQQGCQQGALSSTWCMLTLCQQPVACIELPMVPCINGHYSWQHSQY